MPKNLRDKVLTPAVLEQLSGLARKAQENPLMRDRLISVRRFITRILGGDPEAIDDSVTATTMPSVQDESLPDYMEKDFVIAPSHGGTDRSPTVEGDL